MFGHITWDKMPFWARRNVCRAMRLVSHWPGSEKKHEKIAKYWRYLSGELTDEMIENIEDDREMADQIPLTLDQMCVVLDAFRSTLFFPASFTHFVCSRIPMSHDMLHLCTGQYTFVCAVDITDILVPLLRCGEPMTWRDVYIQDNYQLGDFMGIMPKAPGLNITCEGPYYICLVSEVYAFLSAWEAQVKPARPTPDMFHEKKVAPT